MRLRKTLTSLAAGTVVAALIGSHLVFGLAGLLVMVGILQLVAILAILEARLEVRSGVDRGDLALRKVSQQIEQCRGETTNKLDDELKAHQGRTDRSFAEFRQAITTEAETGLWHQYRQVEALLALYHDVQPKVAFPPLRSWTASPDLLHYLYRITIGSRPACVLELGSGVSTIVIAYALKQAGLGAIVSLEHLEQFRAATEALIDIHGLNEWVDLRLATLEPVQVDGDTYLWYSTDALPDGPIDLVFVDGPPRDTQPRARYPALPLVFQQLSENAIVVLDDCVRYDEAEVAEQWAQRHSSLSVSRLPHEKGTAVFERKLP